MPDAALWSVRGAEINAIWNYQDTKQNIENTTDSLINYYKAYKDNKNAK